MAPAQGRLADDLGRVYQGPLPARRVVSLAPNVTEIVGALGACDRLVGIDTASDFPPEALKVARVGDFLNPSVERLVALRADVVLLSSGTVRADDVREVQARWHTPVFVLAPRRLKDVSSNVRMVGRLLGLETKADAVAAGMDRRLDAVAKAVAGRPRPRVFLEVWHEPLTTAGPATVLDDLIQLAGGRNVAARQPMEFPSYSLEALLRSDPEVYVVAGMDRKLTSDPSTRPGFGAIRAVRSGRVCRVPSDPVLRPTPRVAKGAEALARAIHPEAFR